MAQAVADRLKGPSYGIVGGRRGLDFALAGEADDADIRRLLRTTPVGGWVSLSYEREPDFFRAAAAEGDVHETLIGRDVSDGSLVVMASRSIRDAWINGRPSRLGYLGQLRLADRRQSRPWPVLEGYRWIRRMVEDGPEATCHITSIVSSNHRARRLLTSRARSLPTYQPLGRFWTLALPCGSRPKPDRGSVDLVDAAPCHREEIVDFLRVELARFQFAPCWSFDELWGGERCPGLAVEDFVLAYRRQRLAGCIAVWDQSPFKQYVVRGYTRGLAAIRPVASLATSLAGWPRLPPVGSTLRQVALSHLAVREDDATVLRALVSAGLERAARRQMAVAAIGLGESHPLLAATRSGFRHLAYRSDIYLVHWDQNNGPDAVVGDRPIQLEAATL